ncbi:MAG: helix-turn-helix domain-containing protein [Candidatus Hydrogenedentota bacterium]
MKKIKKPKTASEILDALEGDDPGLKRIQEEVSEQIEIAQLIYDARIDAGLSQTKLANMIGTTQSVISRLEDANYTGHSLYMLYRIAAALGKTVDIRLVAKSSAPRKSAVEKKRKAS